MCNRLAWMLCLSLSKNSDKTKCFYLTNHNFWLNMNFHVGYIARGYQWQLRANDKIPLRKSINSVKPR